MSDWEHKDVWIRREKDFAVEVPSFKDLYGGMGTNRWCVYVYVYPEHPFFKECSAEEGNGSRLVDFLPLHCGCTFFHAHRNEKGEITSFQIGADYAHLYDEHYTFLKSKEDTGPVFADAESLRAYMERGVLE